ncbi:hypothetical protein [Bythopirellula goksoeyrii]|uniref:hypothetical protein n=1 Tax=Bythopirellula goksoeyrii TaxID=1400387 RepID=UPI00143DED6C|nr:hypothetical protein [Bythopirellula goksoeyrii]
MGHLWKLLCQPEYVDAIAVRFYDADTDGNLAENNDGAAGGTARVPPAVYKCESQC